MMQKILLLLALLLSVATGAMGTVTLNEVNNDESVEYVSCTWDVIGKKVVKSNNAATNVEELTSNTSSKHTILKDGWYVVNSDIEYKEYIDIDGDVNIILVDGKTMHAKNGIRIKGEKKLTIYGQKGNTGKIKADASIGAKGDIVAGELVIHGGTIECKGKSHNNAAIGSGNGDNNSNTNFKAITIYDGNITAQAAGGGAAIGSGQECKPHGPITIYGGTINAKGGSNGGAGIGGGEESSSGPIYIYGGNVTAEGTGYAAGIGCGEDSHLTNDIYILGGTVSATSGKGGTGIGVGGYTLGYDLEHLFDNDQHCSLYIQDATVTVRGRESSLNNGVCICVKNLEIRNSTVNLLGDDGTFGGETVVLGDNLSLTLDGKLIVKGDRENSLKYGTSSATIKPCEHSGGTFTDNGDGTHTVNCNYCNGVTEPHNFVNMNGTVRCPQCGVMKSCTAQSLWCEDNQTLYFVYTQEVYEKGGMYDGQTITAVTSGDLVTNRGNEEPTWGIINKSKIMTVVFDKSFALARPKSLCRWFADCRYLTIEGIENLNTSECTTMKGMFTNCNGLTSIDVSGFDMSKVENTESMFRNCEALKTIFCDNAWSDIDNSEFMFNNCRSLKGSMGTVAFDNSYANDISFANPTSGYFTNNGAVFAQALWCDGDKTLYFIHPEIPVKEGETYNGQTVTSVWCGGNVLDTGNSAPGWSDVKDLAVKVVFDASFAEAKPTSLASWFSDFTSLTSADLNGLNVSGAESAAAMFSGCSNLNILYCDSTWTIANTEGMFTGCTSLKGAVVSDTRYDNGIMANPTTGYFTKNWTVEILNGGITVSNPAPFTNETVTISGMGDSGTGIVTVNVTGQRTGDDIAVTENGDGTWSFTMPAEDVIVREKIDIAIYDGKDNSEVLQHYDGNTVNVTYDRILKAIDNGDGTWTSKAYTVCLPYEKDLQDEFWADKVRLYELAIVNDDYEFVFNGVPTAIISAGRPYLVVVDKGNIDLSAEGVQTQALPEHNEVDGVVYPSVEAWQNQDNVCGWWRGTYHPIENEEATQQHLFGLFSDGRWKSFDNDTEAHRRAYIPTFRAYYLPKEFPGYSIYTTKFTVLGAGGDPAEMWYQLPDSFEGDGDAVGATGIHPVIHTIDLDGTDTYYDLQGRRLNGKPSHNGIYINNGKISVINK